MSAIYAILAVATVPATLVLSNLFWQALREARAIARVKGSSDMLQGVLTPDLLASPPAEVARFAQPLPDGYGLNMRIFDEADREAHHRARAIIRPVLAVVVLGSGLLGFLSVGWLGIGLSLINLFFVHTTFVGSTRGSVDEATMSRAVRHIQVRALILDRWYRQNSKDVEAWLEKKPELGPLYQRLRVLHHLSNLALFEKADSDRVGIAQNLRFPDPALRKVVDRRKLMAALDDLDSHTVYRASLIAKLLVGSGLPAVLSADGSLVTVAGYALEPVMPEMGEPGISALTVLEFAYRLILQTAPDSKMIGRGFWFRDVLAKLKAEVGTTSSQA